MTPNILQCVMKLRNWLLGFMFLGSLLVAGTPAGWTDEFRGIWVSTSDVYQRPDGTLVPTHLLQTRIREVLDRIQAAGLNNVLWHVRQGGVAYYESPFEPWGGFLRFKSPGFDPLAFAITEAHARGLKLHAWVNTFEASLKFKGTPAREHPKWIARDSKGRPMPQDFALSPGIPEVRDYLKEIAVDLVNRYDLDGLHLDYVRWNEMRWSFFSETEKDDRFLYDSQHPARRKAPEGFPTWDDWRRSTVTRFVQAVGDAIKQKKPSIIFSVAAIGNYNWRGWNGYSAVFQDSALWLNEGYIDQIMGMNYEWPNAKTITTHLNGNGPKSWEGYLTKAIQEGRCFTVGIGSHNLRKNQQWWRHDELIEAVRKASWTCGVQFFSYGDWEKKRYFEKAKKKFFL